MHNISVYVKCVFREKLGVQNPPFKRNNKQVNLPFVKALGSLG